MRSHHSWPQTCSIPSSPTHHLLRLFDHTLPANIGTTYLPPLKPAHIKFTQNRLAKFCISEVTSVSYLSQVFMNLSATFDFGTYDKTCDLWHIWSEWWGDMTWWEKKTMTKTKTKTMTETNTFRDHLQRTILETFDLWDILSEWWGDMTWPTKRQWQRQRQWQMKNTLKEKS